MRRAPRAVAGAAGDWLRLPRRRRRRRRRSTRPGPWRRRAQRRSRKERAASPPTAARLRFRRCASTSTSRSAGDATAHRALALDFARRTSSLSSRVRGDAPLEQPRIQADRLPVATMSGGTRGPIRVSQRMERPCDIARATSRSPGGRHEAARRRRVAAIEFVVTAGQGGAGTVWIERARVRPRDAERPYDLTPASHTHPAPRRASGAAAMDGDMATAWRSAPADGSGSPWTSCVARMNTAALTFRWRTARTPPSTRRQSANGDTLGARTRSAAATAAATTSICAMRRGALDPRDEGGRRRRVGLARSRNLVVQPEAGRDSATRSSATSPKTRRAAPIRAASRRTAVLDRGRAGRRAPSGPARRGWRARARKGGCSIEPFLVSMAGA